MLIRDLLKKTNKFLTLESTFNKLYESQLLLSYLLNKNIIEIILNKNLVISDKKKKNIFKKNFFKKFWQTIIQNNWLQRFLFKKIFCKFLYIRSKTRV